MSFVLSVIQLQTVLKDSVCTAQRTFCLCYEQNVDAECRNNRCLSSVFLTDALAKEKCFVTKKADKSMDEASVINL